MPKTGAATFLKDNNDSALNLKTDLFVLFPHLLTGRLHHVFNA